MGLSDRAKELADQHEDEIEDPLDKVADFVDDKTVGKYSDKIDSGVQRAKGLVGDDEAQAAARQEPPSKLEP